MYSQYRKLHVLEKEAKEGKKEEENANKTTEVEPSLEEKRSTEVEPSLEENRSTEEGPSLEENRSTEVEPSLKENRSTELGPSLEENSSTMGAKDSKTFTIPENDPNDPVIEAVVCDKEELKDGEMREVEVGEHKILLVREAGEYHALSAKCTHYGAPLRTGVLSHGQVRCPWHGACFNIKTGDIEDFPGLDSLQKFTVFVSGNHIKVRANKSQLELTKRVKPMCRKADGDKRTFLIIGGGGAASSCVETLRQEGFEGKIIMATKESHLPYDRPKLSKALDSSADALSLRKQIDYSTYHVRVDTESEVSSIDFEKKSATLINGKLLHYDKLLLATGGRPLTLDIPGKQLHNIFVLRTVDDGNSIAAQAKERNVVIIGTSFIGLEVAAFLSNKAASVTVVGRSEVPLKHVLGDRIGNVIKKLLEDKGVRFLFNNPPKEFLGSDGQLQHVELADGTILDADVCILGIGVQPETEFVKESGLEMASSGYVLVDKHMCTNIPDVFAAGDIVEFPLFLAGDEHVNIQHWQMALMQGKVAAENMAGKTREIKSVPFFWTTILNKSLRYTGYGTGYDDVIIHGDLDALTFVAFYTKGDRVVAVASMNSDPVVAQAAEMMLSDKEITKTDLQSDPLEYPLGWTSRLKS